MAKINRFQSQVRRTRAQSTKLTGGATAESFGMEEARQDQTIGNALSTLGYAGLKAGVTMAKRSQDRKDKAMARDALNAARKDTREYMSNLQTQKGENAMEAYSDAQPIFEDIQRRYTEKLTNTRQKEYFKASFDGVKNSRLDQALAYQESERKRFDVATMGAENLNVAADAISSRVNPTDTENFVINSAERTIRLNSLALTPGMGKASEKLAADNVHKMYTGVIGAFTKDSPKKGKAALETYWEKLDKTKRGDMKAEIDKLVEAEYIFESGKAIANSGMSLEDQYKAIEKLGTTAERKKGMTTLVDDAHSEREKVKKIDDRVVMNTEVDKVFKNPELYEVPYALDYKDQEHLYNLKKKLIDDANAKSGAGGAAKTNWLVYHKLKNMDPQEFAAADLVRDYYKDLAPAEIKHFTDLQASGKNYQDMRPHQQLETAIKSITALDPKEGTEQGERKNRLVAAFSQEVGLLPKKERTEENINKIIRNLLAPISTNTDFFDLSLDKSYYNFEAPYVEEDKQKILEPDETPESLKGTANLKYSPADKLLYTEEGGVIRTYDLDGQPLKTYRKTR